MKFTTITAIIGIAALQIIAIFKGLDSQYYWLAITTIAGLGGFAVSQIKKGD